MEETITEDIESLTKEKGSSVEAVALILQMANTRYEPDTGNDSNVQLIESQRRLKEITLGSKERINEYLSLLHKKGFIRYYEEEGIYIPTDKGLHFLKIYHMLASLLI